MAVGPGHRRRMPRRRLLSIELGGAAVICAIAVAVAVGISQATSSPACMSAASFAVAAGSAQDAAQGAAQDSAAGSAQGSAAQEAAAGAVQGMAQDQTSGVTQGQTSGEATHYVLQPGNGNCSYPAANTAQYFVALSPAEYGIAAACGSYIEVTGPDGSVTAEVVDQCPPCQSGHIDLGEPAFSQIAPLAAGLVSVSYHTIVDPPLPGPLAFRVKEGSSAYWLALLPINNGNPITSVRVSSASHGWQDLSRASYNYWLAPSGMGAGPFTVQLTDSAGHQVTVTGISLAPGVVQATSTWMYGAGAAAAAVPAAAAPGGAATSASPTPPGPSPAGTSASPTPSRSAPVPVAAARRPTASPTPSC
jgi:expansin